MRRLLAVRGGAAGVWRPSWLGLASSAPVFGGAAGPEWPSRRPGPSRSTS